ncbi:MAG: arsenic resistance N-acetyltransferase ArsN2 [Bacteroidota bacterium]
MINLRKASSADLEKILALLSSHQLPVADVGKHLEHFIVAETNGQIIGCIGMEVYVDQALLRSFAVDKNYQGRGVGETLYQQLRAYATSKKISTFHLLTTTAESYFSKRGFQLADRNTSPVAIKSTSEFTELCPSTARYMAVKL